MLLLQARRQRIQHMRSLPPDPYRVPPELIKGGAMDEQKAINVIQSRVRAWLVRRELAKEAMEAEKREQERADGLQQDVEKYDEEEQQAAGLLAAAEQRAAERGDRLERFRERIYVRSRGRACGGVAAATDTALTSSALPHVQELEALLKRAKARKRREENAMAEAEAEAKLGSYQSKRIASVTQCVPANLFTETGHALLTPALPHRRDLAYAPVPSSLQRSSGTTGRTLSPLRAARARTQRQHRKPAFGEEVGGRPFPPKPAMPHLLPCRRSAGCAGAGRGRGLSCPAAQRLETHCHTVHQPVGGARGVSGQAAGTCQRCGGRGRGLGRRRLAGVRICPRRRRHHLHRLCPGVAAAGCGGCRGAAVTCRRRKHAAEPRFGPVGRVPRRGAAAAAADRGRGHGSGHGPPAPNSVAHGDGSAPAGAVRGDCEAAERVTAVRGCA